MKARSKGTSLLKIQGNKNIDINLEVQIACANFDAYTVSKSNYKYMYWNMTQQLAHHTVNGCDIHAGDMMASEQFQEITKVLMVQC